jgi:competence protein ComEC
MKKILYCTLLLLTSCYSIDPFEDRTQPTPSIQTTEKSSVGQELKIYLPYIGQGDATLIVFPNGNSLLIDTGAKTTGPGPILHLLKDLNLKSIEGVVVTHYDADHIGGFAPLVAGEDGVLGTKDDLKVDKVYDRGGEPLDSSPEYPAYLEAIEALGIPRVTLNPGDSIPLDSEVQVTCMAVNASVFDPSAGTQFIDLSPATYAQKENATSVSLLLEYGTIRHLTSGDLTGGGSSNGFLTPDIETLLAGSVGKVALLHVNHHGSRSSSNPTFVTTTSPDAVFIQAGIDNPYGHPVPEIVQRWKDIGAEVYSTQNGNGFLVRTDGEQFEIETIDRF